MAELTISDLRNLETAESSLLFAVDGDTETFNLTLNTLFEYTKDRLGYLETGAIEMYTGEAIPGTHTELDGKSFDPLVFPKMGALFPAGTLPDTRGMTLKHAPDGRSVLSFEAETVKSHDHTATFTADPHGHDYAAVNIAHTLQGGSVWAGCVNTTKATTDEIVTGSVAVNASGGAKNLVDNIAVKFIIKKA